MFHDDNKLTGFNLEVYIITNRCSEESVEITRQETAPSLSFEFVKDDDKKLVQRPRKIVATGQKAHKLEDLVLLFPGQRISTKDMASDIIRWQNTLVQEEFEKAS